MASNAVVLQIYNLDHGVTVNFLQQVTGCPVKFVHLCGSNHPYTKDIGIYVNDRTSGGVKQVIKRIKDTFPNTTVNKRTSSEGDRKSHKRGSVVVMIQCVLEPGHTLTDSECSDVLMFFTSEAMEQLGLDVTQYTRAIGRQKKTNDRCNIVTIYMECPTDETALKIIGKYSNSDSAAVQPLLDAVPFQITRGVETHTFYVSTLQTSVKSKCYTSKDNSVPLDTLENPRIPPLVEKTELVFKHYSRVIWKHEFRSDTPIKVVRQQLADILNLPHEAVFIQSGMQSPKEAMLNRRIMDYMFENGVVQIKLKTILRRSTRQPPPRALSNHHQERRKIFADLNKARESAKPVLLTGPPGSGKMTVIKHFLSEEKPNCNIHFISASSSEAIYAGLLDIVRQACIQNQQASDIQAKLEEVREPRDLIDAVFSMIDKGSDHAFIFGGVRDKEDVLPWLETRRRVQIFISGSEDLDIPETAVSNVKCPIFSSAEAVSYTMLEVPTAGLQDVTDLVTSLGTSPYSIESSLILFRSTGVDFTRFAGNRWTPEGVFQARIKSLPSLAIDMLCCASYLSCSLVQFWVLGFFITDASNEKMQSALSACESLGLIAVQEESGATVIRMHRSTAEQLQLALTRTVQERGFTTTITRNKILTRLFTAMPDITEHPEFWEDAVWLLPHAVSALRTRNSEDPKPGLELDFRLKIASCFSLLTKDDSKALEQYYKAEKLASSDDCSLMLFLKQKIGAALTSKADHREALPYYMEALRLTKEMAKDGIQNQDDIAKELYRVAKCHHSLGNLSEAQPYIEESISIYEYTAPKCDGLARCLVIQGLLLSERNDHQKAFVTLDNALTILQKTRHITDPEIVEVSIYLGTVAHRARDFPHAIEYLETAAKHCRPAFKTANKIWADCLYTLADAKQVIGTTTTEYFEEALKLHKRLYPSDHPSILKIKGSIGLCHHKLGDKERALSNMLDACNGMAQTPELAEERATMLMNIAAIYQDKGEPHKAVEFLHTALSVRQQLSDGGENQYIASSLHKLGAAYKDIGDLQKALQYMDQALSMRKRIFGEKHSEVSNTLNNIGLVYKHRSLGDYKKALEYLVGSLKMSRELANEPNHPSIATSLNNVGGVYQDMNDLPQALRYLEEGLAMRKSLYGAVHADVASSKHNLGMAYKAIGSLPKAVELLEDAYLIRKKVFGENHKTSRDSLAAIEATHSEAEVQYARLQHTFNRVLNLPPPNVPRRPVHAQAGVQGVPITVNPVQMPSMLNSFGGLGGLM